MIHKHDILEAPPGRSDQDRKIGKIILHPIQSWINSVHHKDRQEAIESLESVNVQIDPDVLDTLPTAGIRAVYSYYHDQPDSSGVLRISSTEE